jgi:monoterpene epsilon-lactone hydrolase
MERQSKYLMMPRRVEVHSVLIVEIYAEWVKPQKRTAKDAILYLHGGGYTMGSCNSYRAYAVRIAVLPATRSAEQLPIST